MVAQSNKKKGNQLIWIGIVISLIGFIITFGSYYGWISTGNVYIFAFGPLLSGFSFIGIGLNKLR